MNSARKSYVLFIWREARLVGSVSKCVLITSGRRQHPIALTFHQLENKQSLKSQGILAYLDSKTQRFAFNVCLYLCPLFSLYLDVSLSLEFPEMPMNVSALSQSFWVWIITWVSVRLHLLPELCANTYIQNPEKKEGRHKTFLFVLTRKDIWSRLCERKTEKERETDCQSWSRPTRSLSYPNREVPAYE